MEELINQLIRIRYERMENKIHTVTGKVKGIDGENVYLEDEDGEIHNIQRKSIDKFEILMLVDETMRERIHNFAGTRIFIEYKTPRSLIRTIGYIKEIFLHNFIFQSQYETETTSIHFDSIIQVCKAEDNNFLTVESLLIN